MSHKCTITVTMTDGLFCNQCQFLAKKSGQNNCVLHGCQLTEYSKNCVAKCAKCGTARAEATVEDTVDATRINKAANLLLSSYIKIYTDLRKQGFSEDVAMKMAKEMCK